MNRASKYIYDFLDNQMGIYYNRQGIEIIVSNDDSVFVNHMLADVPMEANDEFGLWHNSNTFEDFIRDFKLTGMRAVKALSPDRLWEKYYTGQAWIYCIIAVNKMYFALNFRLKGNKMIVCDEYDHEYELDEILFTPKQFIAYTRQQLLLQEG